MNNIERMNVRSLSSMIADASGLERLKLAAKLRATLQTATSESFIVSGYNKDIGKPADTGTPQLPGKGTEMRLTMNAVNAALKAAGHDAELVKGEGYFWFDGDEASTFYSSSVSVYKLTDIPTIAQWVEKYEQLKGDNAKRRGLDVTPALTPAPAPAPAAPTAKPTRAERLEAEARALLAEGFETKAAQQRAKEKVATAYGDIKDAIQNVHLDGERTPASEAVYFAIPSYPHEWRPRHAQMIRDDLQGAAVYIEVAERLVALSNDIKSRPLLDKIANERVAKERAKVLVQSLNPTLRAEFEAQAPAIAADFDAYARSTYKALQKKFPEGVPAHIGHTGPGREYRNDVVFLQGMCDITHATGPSGIPNAMDRISTMTLNEVKLKDQAEEYGIASALEWFYKTNGKLGELTHATLLNDDRGYVHVKGERAGKPVEIIQQRIINVSPLGKAFHQFPSRIYIAGKFITELDYQKLMEVPAPAADTSPE